MLRLHHRFALEFLDADGHPVGQVPVRPCWEPALEWNAFKVRRRLLPSADWNTPAVADLEPVPLRGPDSACCAGFRLVTAIGNAPPVETTFPLEYFSDLAREHAAALVQDGRLKHGEVFLYKLLAYPGAESQGPASAFKIREAPANPAPEDAPLAPIEERATPFGTLQADDIPVFIPRSVLAEAASMTEQAGPVEIGAVLIGRLQRDPSRPEIAAVVTAQIPAKHLESKLASVTFTPDTWAAARAAIALRNSGEIFIGWAHSHPSKFWCLPSCPPDRRRVCAWHADFFSQADFRFHAAVFPKAYTVALVVTHTDDGLKHALFGWRAGLMRQRGFHILNDDSRPIRPVEAVHPNQDTSHAKNCPA